MLQSDKYMALLKKKRRALVSLLAVGALVIVTVIANMIMGFSWFSSNRAAGASGIMLKVEKRNTSVSGFEYIPGSTPSLDPLRELELDMLPGDEKIIVMLIRNETAYPLDITVGFSDLAVCYYKLQTSGMNDFAYDSFLRPYIDAGPYTYIDNGSIVTVDPAEIDTAEYLSFVHPVSNAVKVSYAVDKTITDATTASEIFELVGSMTDYSPQQPVTLLSSSHGITQELGATTAPDFLFPLNTGTAPSFGGIRLDADERCVLAIKLTFDGTVASTAGIDIDGIPRSVTLGNSNPFMYQRFRIGSLVIDDEPAA